MNYFDGVESTLMELNYDLDLFVLFKADLYSCSAMDPSRQAVMLDGRMFASTALRLACSFRIQQIMASALQSSQSTFQPSTRFVTH